MSYAEQQFADKEEGAEFSDTMVSIAMQRMDDKSLTTLSQVLEDQQQYPMQLRLSISNDLDKETRGKLFSAIWSKLNQLDEQLTINSSHVRKLHQLYKQSDETFLYSLAIVLRRYTTVFGNQCVIKYKGREGRPNQFEGTSFHASVTENLFKVLKTQLGVNFECFASPLNCFYGNYCSAFLDTDGQFGSVGSFFETKFKKGIFECNPPFTEEIIQLAAEKCIRDCSSAEGELGFIFVVPEWRKPVARYHTLLESDASKTVVRGWIQLLPKEHYYICGDQQKVPSSQKCYKTPHGSVIYAIFNDAAFQRCFGSSPDRLNEFLE